MGQISNSMYVQVASGKGWEVELRDSLAFWLYLQSVERSDAGEFNEAAIEDWVTWQEEV